VAPASFATILPHFISPRTRPSWIARRNAVQRIAGASTSANVFVALPAKSAQCTLMKYARDSPKGRAARSETASAPVVYVARQLVRRRRDQAPQLEDFHVSGERVIEVDLCGKANTILSEPDSARLLIRKFIGRVLRNESRRRVAESGHFVAP
jgi:hypothetical protein